MVQAHGSAVTYHRDTGWIQCPCVTPEGFRDPTYHDDLKTAMDEINAEITADQDTTSAALDPTHSYEWYIVAGSSSFALGPVEDIWGYGPQTDAYRVIFHNLFRPAFPGLDRLFWMRAVDGGAMQLLSAILSPTPDQTDEAPWNYSNPMPYPIFDECNEAGLLPAPGAADIAIKGFVQPAQSTRLTRLADEYLTQMFGQIQTDDHVGIFPTIWAGNTLNFRDWSQTGAEYVLYDTRKFMVVNANLIPDPSDGNPYHHWEVALRLIT